MSDENQKTLKDFGSGAFKTIMALLAFFAATVLNDMRDSQHEMKADIKEINTKVGSTREDMIELKSTVQANKDRIDRIETRRK